MTGRPGRARARSAASATTARASGPIAALSSVKNTTGSGRCRHARASRRSARDPQAARASSDGRTAAKVALRRTAFSFDAEPRAAPASPAGIDSGRRMVSENAEQGTPRRFQGRAEHQVR